MIGKISKSGSFKNLVEYLDKEDSVVLGTNMYGLDSRELTAEFMTVYDLNPGIKQPVLHASLSLSPGESLNDEQLREACEAWMEKMGFDLAKNQYLLVRHKDTEHEHAHLAINRIDMVSGKVVVDSYERYRSQEIIRQLERNYGLEQVAPSWQTFKYLEPDLEPNPELSRRRQLAALIERAALDSPTMPEFFQRLAECQIRAEVSFTRTGKPRGITYQPLDQEQVAGNALGKAYSFPGLQKYLKVNYDPARDNQKLAEIVQSTRQQHDDLPQQAALVDYLEPNYQLQQVEATAQLEALRQQSSEAARLEAQRLESEHQRQLDQLRLKEEAAERERLHAEARQLKAEETLELKRLVDTYFQAAPRNCSDKDLIAASKQQRYWSQKVGQVYRDLEALTQQLGAANFWQRLLPQHERGVSKLKDLMVESEQADAKKAEADKLYLERQQVRQQYMEWEQSPQTQKMRSRASYLLTPQGQELVAAGLEIERERELERTTELRRLQQQEHTEYKLQQWYITAEKLKRTPEYLNWIREIKREFTAGTSIPEQATTAMSVDFKEQLRHSQEKEIEQQRSTRDWDLSL